MRGRWQLDIGLCAWGIANWNDRIEVAHCESPLEEIDEAVRFLDGQKLESTPKWSAKKAALTFRFDLGGLLRTWGWKNDPEIDPTSHQWTLYEPDDYYLSCDQADRLSRTHKSESPHVR